MKNSLEIISNIDYKYHVAVMCIAVSSYTLHITSFQIVILLLVPLNNGIFGLMLNVSIRNEMSTFFDLEKSKTIHVPSHR